MIRRQPKFNRSIIHIDIIDDVKTHILSIYSDISDNLIDLHQSISLPLSTENWFRLLFFILHYYTF